MDVRVELSVVKASAASGARSVSNRLTSSAAKCCASAAEPPLPQASALPPLRRQSASSALARATGPASDCDAANLRFALSAKCAATRAERAAFCSACPMSSILLEVNLELDARSEEHTSELQS